VLAIPYIGLDYMRIFFHELGHCVTFWLFGYPAVPTFDFEYGGGMTYPVIGRIWLVQGISFAGLAAGIYYLCRGDGVLFDNERRPLLVIVILLTLLIAGLAFTQGHNVAILFMGYGAEVCIAVFCMARAILGLTLYGAVERYLNMTFGLYIIGLNAMILRGLMTSDIAREAYGMQKGGELQGDFDQIADLLGTTLQSVAGLSLGFMGLILIGLVVFVIWWKNNEEVPA
jgi:membrane-associated protease RseP (regulator of RpoE activity)